MKLDDCKKDTQAFLTEQLQKLDDSEKEKLAYVLLGATLTSPLKARIGSRSGLNVDKEEERIHE